MYIFVAGVIIVTVWLNALIRTVCTYTQVVWLYGWFHLDQFGLHDEIVLVFLVKYWWNDTPANNAMTCQLLYMYVEYVIYNCCLKSKSNLAENHKNKLKDCNIVWYTEYITVIILMCLLSNCTLNTILTEFHLLQHVFVLQTTDFLAK